MAATGTKAFRLDASSSNIPTSFTTGAGSLVMTGGANKGFFAIINYCTANLAVNYTWNDTATSPTLVDAYVPAAVSGGGPGVLCLDNSLVSNTVFIASDSGATLASGIVRGFCTAEGPNI